MIRSTDLAQFEELCVKFLEANTPGYLYRHFRKSTGPQQLAQRFNARELVAEIEQLSGAAPRDLANTILAYACAVALTYRPLREMLDALREGPKISPPWFRYIIESYRVGAISDTSSGPVPAVGLEPGLLRISVSSVASKEEKKPLRLSGGAVIKPAPSTVVNSQDGEAPQ